MRILIVDDHAIVRKGLIQILNDEPENFIIGEAKDSDDALEKIRQSKWDMVILDINLPGRSGLEVLSIIHELNPLLPVLILSNYSEDQYAIRALKSGALGYLNKQSAPEELITAIKKIRRGEKYITSSQSALLLDSMLNQDNSHIARLQTLSNREVEVLRLIGLGNTLTNIAQILSISIRTVSTYRTRIMTKLGLKNNIDLIAFALNNHLIE